MSEPKPAQEQAIVVGCEITGGSSRTCEHGQKGCEIRHKPAQECIHDLAEQETACADGMCPICLSAALAAERERNPENEDQVCNLQDENSQLRKQLAALEEQGSKYHADDLHEIAQLRLQLDAEREKVQRRDLLVRTWQDNYNDREKEIQKLRLQLAAEIAKHEPLAAIKEGKHGD